MGKGNKEQQQNRGKKAFSIQDLVRIGDDIHHSDCAIVLCLEKQEGTMRKLSGQISGSIRDLEIMLLQAMEENEHLENLLTSVLLEKKMANIEKMANKFK